MGEPRDIEYSLDYSSYEKGEKDNYITMFQDYGWESFRKETEDADTETFSDDCCRLALVKKVFLSRLLPIIMLFAVVFLFDSEYMFSVDNMTLPSFSS